MPLETFMKASTLLLCLPLLGTLASGGCATPHQEAAPGSVEIKGKSQAWFQEHWGQPGAKAKRFFGGETWVYFRLTGGKSSFPLFNMIPAECQIRLDFDHEGTLEDSSYSGC